MADIGKPLKRVRTFPLTEPVPDNEREPKRAAPPPTKTPVKAPQKEPTP